jgi:MT-A70
MLLTPISALSRVEPDYNFSESKTAISFFDPLLARSYDLVVIDPPWPFATWSAAGQGKSASKHYRVMTLAEIMALPVRELLKDHAVLLLWATGAMLAQAVAVMEAWGIHACAPGFTMGCEALTLIPQGQMNWPHSANCKLYRDEHLAARSGAC